MDKDKLRKLLRDVAGGRMNPDKALESLYGFPYENIGCARLDHHRHLRQGFPEVIFGQGKTPAQIARIFFHLARQSTPVLATRATPEDFRAVRRVLPKAVYHAAARCIVLGEPKPVQNSGPGVTVFSAGTADLPVAEEAAVCARVMGHQVDLVPDVGVSGIHRLLDQGELLRQSQVIIAVAGMEGALPSVVAGLTARPVIAVPTSIGYGASLSGIAALLAMLNSCAPGVAVVNIDNGYGAAAMADAIIRTGREA